MNAQWKLAGLLTAACWLPFGVIARAENLDTKLLEEAPRILEVLKNKDCKNVGVLRFQVQKDGKAASFQVGPLNGNLPRRLERAMILSLNPEHPVLGVVSEVGREASQPKYRVGDWASKEAERAKLFAIEYPLAWGHKEVKADVMLSGRVEVAQDYQKASVTITGFTAKEPGKVFQVAHFDFTPDLPFLHDLGTTYRIRSLPDKKDVLTMRKTVFKPGELKRRDDPPPAASTSLKIDAIEFTLLGGDQPTEFKPASESKKYEMVCPASDKVVTMRLKNTGTKDLGVVIILNGSAVLFGTQDGQAESLPMFVVKAGADYPPIRGMLKEGESTNVSPFKIVTGEEEQKKRTDLGEKAGRLEIYVFAEGGEEMLVGRRLAGPPAATDKKARSSLVAYQHALMKSSMVKRVFKEVKVDGKLEKRELIVPDDDEAKKLSQKFKEVPFKRAPGAIDSAQVQIVPAAGPGS